MAKGKRSYRVGISGSYGGLNLGDEAILKSIVAELRSALPVEITVFSRNAEDTRTRHQVERVVPVRKLSRDEVLPEVQRLDLLILGGGGILFDGEAHVFLREVVLAHEHRVPVMVYAVSAGPLRDPEVQRMVRDGLNRAAVVTVRERGARQVLEDVGLHREIIVTADPALLLEPEPLAKDALKREGLDHGRHLVGLSVREPGAAAPEISEQAYHKLLADTADFMVDRYDADVVFVPMEPKM
jgi:polysaccharide pyruvyl transferase WcaK-like protein